MDKTNIDRHILNPYNGCFMLVGLFDGIIGNLIWHALVLACYPILLLITSLAVFSYYLRKLGPDGRGRFSKYYTEQENDF